MAAEFDDDPCPPPPDRWHRVYLLVTAVGLCTVVLSWYEVPPFDALTGLAVAALVTGLFAAASVLYWYDVARRRRRFERDRSGSE